MKRKKYDVILFDVDGTLVDSDPMVLEAMNVLYDKYRGGVRTPPEKVIYFSGPPIRDTLHNEFPDLDNDFIFEQFAIESEKLYATHIFNYPHSKEVLLRLKEQGFKLGIVTNKVHRLTEYCLECVGLTGIFDCIVGFDEVVNCKPDREGMDKAMAYFGSTKERTLYFGDNALDLQTARNAGVDCALVKWGPRVLPADVIPEYWVKSYLDLEDILYE